jgi:flagellar hook-associated protein 1 FlgK
MGTFDGLRIALSSLQTQQRAMNTTGQNISNVNTDGYSRQRIDMVADNGGPVPAVYAKFEGTGMGVRSDNVSRMRDAFLDNRGFQEHATDANLTRLDSTYGQIEATFGEPSDTALAAQMGDFLASWDDVANHPDDVAARAQLLQEAGTVTSGFEEVDANLANYRSALTRQLATSTTEVNNLADRVGDLNSRIQTTVAAGLNANDLMDQRDKLVQTLSERTGASVQAGDLGMVNVFIGGTALVRGALAEHLNADVAPTGNITMKWNRDGTTANVGGEAAASIDSVNNVLPKYQADLKGVATTLMNDVNAIHQSGFDTAGNAGLAFFVMDAGGHLAVNPAVAADGQLVAASGVAGAVDGGTAQKIAKLTSAHDKYSDLVVGLGVEAQTATRRKSIQDSIVQQVDDSRESAAGVNLDEEMTNMLSYQHAYNAAAKFLSTVDSTIDTLIGMVR